MTEFARDERGATAIEYALIAGIMAIVVVTTVSVIGTNVKALFERVVF